MEKLLLIQQLLEVEKTKTPEGYSAWTFEPLLHALKPLLQNQNCLLFFSEEIINVGNFNYSKATATIIDNTSGESFSATGFSREAINRMGWEDEKLTGSASTYAKKRALSNLLLLSSDTDVDSFPEPAEEKIEDVFKRLKYEVRRCTTGNQLNNFLVHNDRQISSLPDGMRKNFDLTLDEVEDSINNQNEVQTDGKEIKFD